MECDVLIKNGWIVDGTGKPGYPGSIAIVKERIIAVGQLEGMSGQTEVDASGHVVAPGFIDVHVHSEKELVHGADRWAGVRQGVTTQLMGPDGFSWSPLSGAVRDEMRQYLEVFYGKVPKEWGSSSVAAFLSLFSGQLPSHVVPQVPHGAIRASIMGWSDRTATDEEIQQMKILVKEWLDAGAVSFCTGLEYEPTVHADIRELIELSRLTREYGGIYVAHQRGYANKIREGTGETFEISKEADIPVHISHLSLDNESEAAINEGVEQGIDVTFDMYPYPAGCSHLLQVLPGWAQAGPPNEVLRRLNDPVDRNKISEHLKKAFPNALYSLDQIRFASIHTLSYKHFEGVTIGAASRQSGLSVEDLICEVLQAAQLQVLMIYHWLPERERFLKTTYQHPLHMVSTDGIFVEGLPHPRGYGTYPLVLGSFVREKAYLSLEKAIYKMSGFPAKRFGLRDRGEISKGKAADLVIFDPNTVHSKASFTDPRILPEGIEHVWVDGRQVIRGGEVTNILPGKILTR